MHSAGALAVVIGGNSAIGYAVVAQLRARGMAVLATHHSGVPGPEEPGVGWYRLDIACDESISDFVDALANGPKVAQLIVVSGVICGKSLPEYSLQAIERVMTVNVSGPSRLIGALFPHFSPGACVILFSSISGERGSYDPVYAASKGAVISLVKSLATWSQGKIRIIAVAPGLVEASGMYESMSIERQEHHRGASPLGRLITPEALARVVVDLTEEHWAYANGTCVRLNGGAYV